MLEERGRVALALPHGERSFDACRPVSTFEDLFAAYLEKLNRPSPRFKFCGACMALPNGREPV